MSTELELLRQKIIRIGKSMDEPTLVFVTTLLTCSGLSFLEYGQPRGFGDFRRVFGDARFTEVKRRLTDEGVVAESNLGLHLNLPGFGELQYDERTSVVQALSKDLFETAEYYFMDALGRVLSSPDGEYVLSELARAGLNVDDDSVGHISKSVGPGYFQTIREQLTNKGLFVFEFSSRKHDYYGLFPPVKDFMRMDSEARRQALAFVYIAQGIREGAGVLKLDCGPYLSDIKALIVRGAIREVRWYGLQGYETTSRGDLLARETVGKRLDSASQEIKRLLETLPTRCVRYFLEDLIFSNDWEGRHERPINRYFRDGQDLWFCLLDDTRLKVVRDQFFNKLVDLGLAAKARSYVSTKGGRVYEPVFVFSAELEEHLAVYFQRHEFAGPLFPDDLERSHAAFHLFADWVRFMTTNSMMGLLERGAATSVDIQPIINELAQQALIQVDGDTLRVINKGAYSKTVAERFRKPIVDYLLETSVRGTRTEPDATRTELVEEPKREVPEQVAGKSAQDAQSWRIMLGSAENGTSVFWEPLEVPNPHLLIVGSPGTGKTQTAKALILEAVSQGLHSFVIDFANEYGDPLLVGLVLKPGDAVTVNPLDLLEGGPTDVVFRVSGILKKIFRLGDQQEGIVRNAVKATYADAGITNDSKTWSKAIPPFARVKDFLEEWASEGRQATTAQRTLTRLEPLFDLKVFSANTQVMFDQILQKGAALYLRDLPTEETKLAVAEFFLRWLWHRVISEGEIRNQLRLLIVMDEAHKLAYDNSPVADFLRQGRKYGAAVVLSTQQPDDFQSKELAFQNTAYHMAFGCNSDKHAQAMAKQMVVGRQAQTQVAQIIRKLKPFEALLAGQAMEKAERLTVLPYHERVTRL